MLVKSDEFLFDKYKEFICKSQNIVLIAPFIKSDLLVELTTISTEIHTIIVRWRKMDIETGSSDINLYEICNDKGIKLYMNDRIHMKVVVDNYRRCLMGSSNISQKGLNYPKSLNFNFELNCLIEALSFEDRLYFSKVLHGSILVTDSIYKQMIEQLDRKVGLYQGSSDFSFDNEPDLLISSLPMSLDPSVLFNVYNEKDSSNEEELDCAIHDLALYRIPSGLDEQEFYLVLKENFNNHPFICAIKEFIRKQETKSLRYGGMVDWISRNTSTVPVPRNWEIKKEQIVNILYEWICDLDNDFFWNRPRYSQVIYYDPKVK